MASSMSTEWYQQQAREMGLDENDFDFDDKPKVSKNDEPDIANGAYVQVWMWVEDPDDELTECECDNTHEQNETVCRFCFDNGIRFTKN